MRVRSWLGVFAVSGMVAQLLGAGAALGAECPRVGNVADEPEAKLGPVGDARSNLWPFYEYRQDRDELRVLSLASWLPAAAVVKPDYTRVLNVSWFEGGDLGRGHAVVPLYLRVEKECGGGLLTALGGYVHTEDVDLFGVLGPVYWKYRSEGTTTQGLLWPALLHSAGPESTDTNLLLGLAGQEQSTAKGVERSSIWLWPLFSWEREADELTFDTALVDYRRTPRLRRTRVSPLGLWTLYESRSELLEDGRTQSRQYVTLGLFERETEGARTSVDAFPFIAYDRDEHVLQWSFLGGLVGWRREADTRTLRLLWLPVLDQQRVAVQ